MDTIELIAASLGLVYILLEYKANPWMWLFSILMSTLYGWVFFSQRMYANLLLSLYNIGVSWWGAHTWRRRREGSTDEAAIRSFPLRGWLLLAAVLIVLTPSLACLLRLFGETEVPLLDGLTASLSVVGIWMLAKKYYQQWLCWIVADALYVAMFVANGMWPSAGLYAAYTVIAIFGFFHWKKSMGGQG